MKPVEHYEENTNTGRKAKNSLLREAIWLQLSIFEGSDRALLFFIAPIQWSKIQVAARHGIVEIIVILFLVKRC
jgi:hypothetical protein